MMAGDRPRENENREAEEEAQALALRAERGSVVEDSRGGIIVELSRVPRADAEALRLVSFPEMGWSFIFTLGISELTSS